jgi:hypothetical protein
MFNVVLPDGTVRICKSKAEAYRVIAESKEAYQGYLMCLLLVGSLLGLFLLVLV